MYHIVISNIAQRITLNKSLFLLGIIPIVSGFVIVSALSYFQAEECKAFSEKYGQEWIRSNIIKCSSLFPEELSFSNLLFSFLTILLTCPVWGGTIMMIYATKTSDSSFLRYVVIGAMLGVFLLLAVFQSTFGYIELLDYSVKKCPSNVEMESTCSFIMKNYNRMELEYSMLVGLSVLSLASAVVYFKMTNDEIKISRHR